MTCCDPAEGALSAWPNDNSVWFSYENGGQQWAETSWEDNHDTKASEKLRMKVFGIIHR